MRCCQLFRRLHVTKNSVLLWLRQIVTYYTGGLLRCLPCLRNNVYSRMNGMIVLQSFHPDNEQLLGRSAWTKHQCRPVSSDDTGRAAWPKHQCRPISSDGAAKVLCYTYLCVCRICYLLSWFCSIFCQFSSLVVSCLRICSDSFYLLKFDFDRACHPYHFIGHFPG